MHHPRKLLWKTLVRQYYRQNAGFFLFFFLIFFGVVAPSQQLAYHYALIRGILSTPPLLVLVLFLWLLYAAKCGQWVIGLQQRHDHAFLHLLPLRGKIKTFCFLLEVQIMLFLPVILYAMAVVGVAVYHSHRMMAAVVSCFILLVCLVAAALYQYELFHPGSLRPVFFLRPRVKRRKRVSYWSVLVRSLLTKHKTLLAGI